jgi:hypothetical protein
MKKVTALLLVMLILLTLLTACGQTTPTRSVRWDSVNGEELVYDIRLIDTLKKQTDNGAVSADYTLLKEDVDQIKPVNAQGTYKTKIIRYGQNIDKMVADLYLVEYYDITEISADFRKQLSERGLIIEETSTEIAVLTQIHSECVFNSASFAPISSIKTVKGAYIGRDRQTINDYTAQCEYDNSLCKVTFTDRINAQNSITYEYTTSGKTEYFDNEMLLYLIRSYDATNTASVTAVGLSEPLIKRDVIPMQFYSQKADVYFSENITLNLYVYSIAVSKTVSMYVSLTNQEQPIFIDGVPVETNKILKIQQGYLVYTLQEDLLNQTVQSINNNNSK